MNSFSKTAVIGATGLIVAGCQLINPKAKVQPTPLPTPMPTTSTSTYFDFNPSPVPTASATLSAQLTTKGGIPVEATPRPKVKGTTTSRSTTYTSVIKNNPNYDTSADTVDFTVYPGQGQETTITLYNKTNDKIMFAVKAPEKQSDTFPIKVNGSNEVTGTIEAQASVNFTISTISTGTAPAFSTSVTVNYVSMNNQILASRSIKVTTHTATGDVTTLDTNTDSDQTGNASMSIKYAPNAAYPVKLHNRHSYSIVWDASVDGANGNLVLSANHGTVDPGQDWFTTVHFTTSDSGATQATIKFTIRRTDGQSQETKTVAVNIYR